MYCKNCGLPLKEEETVCPSCNTPIGDAIEGKIIDDTTFSSNLKYENTKELYDKYGFNKLLVFCLLEIFCCSGIFGLIALVILLTRLNTAIKQNSSEDINKAKKNVTTILIIGLIWGILVNLGNMVFGILAALGELFI